MSKRQQGWAEADTKALAVAIALRINVQCASAETGYAERTIWSWVKQVREGADPELAEAAASALSWDDLNGIRVRHLHDSAVAFVEESVSLARKAIELAQDPDADPFRIKALSDLVGSIAKMQRQTTFAASDMLERHDESQALRKRLEVLRLPSPRSDRVMMLAAANGDDGDGD